MNAGGVLGSMCFPSFPSFSGRVFGASSDKDLALAVLQAYNDWHIDEWCASAPGRFIPMAITPLWDAEACAAEIRRVAAKGVHSISFTENPAALGFDSFHNPSWDPVWEACAGLEMPVHFHIGASLTTMNFFGNYPWESHDDDTKLDTLRPLNMYGYSKHLFDLHARRAGFLNKIVGLKYFNVFGPNEDHKGDMRSLVHKSFAQVQSKGVIQLFKSYRKDYKDGEQKRDFLYVKDCVAMTLHLAATSKANGLFNIGSGGARSWIDLANAVFTALKKKPVIKFIEMPETIRDKYQYFTQANLMRLHGSGYSTPVTSLENAVHDYVRKYLVPDKRLDPSVS